MSNDLADFMLSNMYRPPSARRNARPGRRYTGAAISSSTLVLATVEAVEFRKLRLCEGDTSFFVLETRNQRSVRCLFNEIQAFVRERALSHVLLRGSPGGGKYAAAPSTYIIEGALNLVQGLHLEVASPGMVSKWERREGRIAPNYPLSTPRSLRETFERAIQSACLSEARERDPEFRATEDRA